MLVYAFKFPVYIIELLKKTVKKIKINLMNLSQITIQSVPIHNSEIQIKISYTKCTSFPEILFIISSFILCKFFFKTVI